MSLYFWTKWKVVEVAEYLKVKGQYQEWKRLHSNSPLTLRAYWRLQEIREYRLKRMLQERRRQEKLELPQKP